MALETVLFPIEFSQGVDTKTDPKRVLPGKLLTLENGMFTKSKKIIKRPGYDVLSKSVIGGADLFTSSGLGLFNSELLQYSFNSLYSYAETLDKWIKKAPLYSIRNFNKSIVRSTYQQSSPDLAVSGNIAVYAYEDTGSGGVNITVLETKTGAVFQNNVNVSATGIMPELLTINNKIFLFYVESNNLKLIQIDPQFPNTYSSSVTLFSDVHATALYDVTPREDVILIAYHTSAGTDQIKVAYITNQGIVGGVSTGWPNALTIAHPVTKCLSLVVDFTTQVICVLYSNSTEGLCYTALNSDFTILQSHSVIDSDTAHPPLRIAPYISTATLLNVFYEKDTSSGNKYDHYVMHRTLPIVGGGGSSVELLRSVGLASRAFKVTSQVGSDLVTEYFINVIHDSDLQSTYFCMRNDGVIVSKMLPLKAGGLPARGVLPSVRVSSSNKVSFPALIKGRFISEDNTTYSLIGLSLEIMDFSNPSPYISKQINDTLIIAGGIVYSYDGFYPTELGFHLFPENVTAVVAPATPLVSQLGQGKYMYAVTYEWVDRAGLIHRSAPIKINVETINTTSKVTLTIPTLRITSKKSENGVSDVMIRVYRTEKDLTIPRLLTTIVYNDVTIDSVDFVDIEADSVIQSHRMLYTEGNVLRNEAPPSAYLMDINKSRVLLAGLEDPYTFAYSKIAIDGEGIDFSNFLQKRTDPLGGAITAIKYMDDKILIFKESHIFFISGEGPTDVLNSAENFSEPVLITSDSGCVDPKSCVLTPLGVMYKSQKGIYLIDRSLGTHYIGADVEAYNAYQVTDATTMTDQSQVKFVLSEKFELMYDYLANQWSVNTKHGGVGNGVWNSQNGDTYVYAKSDGRVYRQNKNIYLDGGSSYSLKIATSWLKVAGLQGFQRVRRAFILGDYLSQHMLRVQIAYDYEPYVSQTILFNATELLDSNHFGDGVFGSEKVFGGSRTAVEQFSIALKKQKCQAIQLIFDDLEDTSSHEGYSLSDLTLEIGLKSGPMRLPSSKRVG